MKEKLPNFLGRTCDPKLIQQVIQYCISLEHKGTKQQKNRSTISGGNKKPWRQKGTGRARASSIRCPIFRGGAVTFARRGEAKHSSKCNKNMIRLCMSSLLTSSLVNGQLEFIDSISVSSSKTKHFPLNNCTLFLHPAEITDNIVLASRNLHHVYVTTTLNPLDVIRAQKLIITSKALESLEYLNR